MTGTKTAVLISGGVDSSLALALLAREGGRELVAHYLKIWLEDELAFLGRCPWAEDLEYARAVAEVVGVRLEVVSLQREYYERVVVDALAELRAGRTPSPDVVCNRRIKLGALAERLGPAFGSIATGHHARIAWRAGRAHLLRGVDPVKDQSYFLCELEQAQLARALFPIGGLSKAEVRAEARALGLPTADRPDSQGICFLGQIRFADFVRHHLGERPGPIRDRDHGEVLGEHRGLWFHTIGQRRGLGLGGGPWYVVAKELETDTLWVVHGDRLAAHARSRFTVARPHWIVDPPSRCELMVRLRHGPSLLRATVEATPEGSLEVALAAADPGIAPGQYAVFYDGEECLGGGVVE